MLVSSSVNSFHMMQAFLPVKLLLITESVGAQSDLLFLIFILERMPLAGDIGSLRAMRRDIEPISQP